MVKRRKKKSNTVSVDFEGVKSYKAVPEGDYTLEVEEVTLEEGAKAEYLKWTFLVVDHDSKVWTNTTCGENPWKLREILDALGQDVPDGSMDIDLDELVGLQCKSTLIHDTYEGKTKAVPSEFFSLSENDDDEEEDEEINVKKMDEDELAELIEEKGLDVDLDDHSTIKKKRKAVQEALESDEEPEEDEPEEDSDEEETYKKKDIKKMDLDDLQALNDDLELEIEDLEDMSEKKAQKAVIKALEGRDLIE